MIKFGIQDEFEIWVDYEYIQNKDDPDYLKSLVHVEHKMWGSIYFWVNKKNIFAFKGYGPEATYTFNVKILVEYFCENLQFILIDDPFPKQTIAKYPAEMMDEVSLVELPDNDVHKYASVDWDNVDSELYDNIDEWNFKHGLIPNNDGSFFPEAYFRKIADKIEISWSNIEPIDTAQGELYFEYDKGAEYVDMRLFRDTVSQFCFDFLERFYDTYPDLFEKFKGYMNAALKIPI